MSDVKGFPSQRLSRNRKNKAWRKQCVDWADRKMSVNYNYIRNSVRHMNINYDLITGKLHMSDLQSVLNPGNIRADFVPDNIAHYPIMLSKLNVLVGEESKRPFEYRVIVTNPTAVSEIEEKKKQEALAEYTSLVESTSMSEEDFNRRLSEIEDRFKYDWQDDREFGANCLIKHYEKELDLALKFNDGFKDVEAVAEEVYQIDIVSGEPTVERIDPRKIEVLRSGYSSNIEDADMIILRDYWSPGRIQEVYGPFLSDKDIKNIENECYASSSGSEGDHDERNGFINAQMVGESLDYFQPLEFVSEFTEGVRIASDAPYDGMGNVRVIRVYWKSYRTILKVKSYDPETGEEEFNLYTDEYIPDEAKGEEIVAKYYINEAWEGTKIGKDTYVNMRPRVIQYNRLSNPSRCHFGIIGSLYNINNQKNYSLVDMMKQYNYLYDVIHDRLNRLLARNWGRLVRLDLSKKPGKWGVDKWLYYAQQMGLVIEDSFNAGTEGYAVGKLAGAMNSNTTGTIDAELGNSIQQYVNLLEFIKMEMAEICGITKQREGQISNRETVGGVERATLQSSHITEYLFIKHENVKKRVYEALLETLKICLRGRTKKFEHILPDSTRITMTIDGDLFAEADYGLLCDNSNNIQELSSKLDTYAQAALQNAQISFSTIYDLYSTASNAEKRRIIQKDEQQIQERTAQQQQQQIQAQQQAEQARYQLEQQKLSLEDQMNQRDNETKLMIASMSGTEGHSYAYDDEIYSQEEKEKLMEQMREFDAEFKLKKDRLEFDKQKAKTDAELKRMQIRKSKATSK